MNKFLFITTIVSTIADFILRLIPTIRKRKELESEKENPPDVVD